MSELSHHIHRARLLMEQQRFADAEKELRQHLGAEPQDVDGLFLLAIVLGAMERFDEARQAANQAIAEDPEEPWAHYGLGCVQLDADRDKEAEACALQALELDPDEPEFWGLLAASRIGRKHWEEALDAAENGLALEPDNVGLLNLRSRILTILGRKDEIGPAAQRALSEDPHDANSHASAGWAALHSGDSKAALVHYREALRLEPDNEFARRGALEALRVRNPLYRGMFKYFAWLERLGNAGFVIILGGWLAYRFGLRMLDELSGVGYAVLLCVLIAYAVFAVSTWIAQPIANMFLFFHPLGRLAMTRQERWHSAAVAGLFAAALATVGLAFALDIGALLVISLQAGLSMLMVAAAGVLLGGRFAAVGYAAMATAGAALAIVCVFLPWSLQDIPEVVQVVQRTFPLATLICLLGFQFLAPVGHRR